MVGGAILRATPRLDGAHKLAIGAAAVAVLDVGASLLIVQWESQLVRIAGAVVLLAAVAWLAFGTRTALIALAALWGVLHSYLSDTDLGGSAGGQSLNLSRALGAAIVLGVGFSLLRSPPRSGRLAVPLRILVVFTVLFAVDTVISPNKSEGVADFIRVAEGVIVGIAAYRLFDTRERLLQLARVVYLAGVTVGFITLLQFTLTRLAPSLAHELFGAHAFIRSYTPGQRAGVQRVLGPLGGPGETAGFLLIAAAFGLLRYTLLRDSHQARRLPVGIGIIATGVLATLTRSSLGALILLLLVWMFQLQLRNISGAALRTKITVIAVVVAILAVPMIGSQTLRSRLWDIRPSSGTSFAQGRGAIWADEIKLLKHSSATQLVFGHGAHSSYLGTYAPGQLTIIENSPHNLLVWLAVETGLVGSVLYIGFLFAAGAAYRRAAREGRFQHTGKVGAAALAGLAAYQLQGLFTLSPNNPGHGVYFMLFIGATLRACTIVTPTDDEEAT